MCSASYNWSEASPHDLLLEAEGSFHKREGSAGKFVEGGCAGGEAGLGASDVVVHDELDGA